MNMFFKKRYSSVQKVKLSFADWPEQQCEDMYSGNLKTISLGRIIAANRGGTPSTNIYCSSRRTAPLNLADVYVVVVISCLQADHPTSTLF